jgi:hypothetical protein
MRKVALFSALMLAVFMAGAVPAAAPYGLGGGSG